MLSYREVQGLLWDSFTDPDLLAQQTTEVSTTLTRFAKEAKQGDFSIIDMLICHFSCAVEKELYLRMVLSTSREGLPC